MSIRVKKIEIKIQQVKNKNAKRQLFANELGKEKN